MTQKIDSSSSFADFYLNENLSGHLFLRPSIWVAKSYKWIFSDIETQGCCAVIEVISRIALFIILPIIAIISAIFIPIGLVSKGIASLCSPPISSKKNAEESNFIPVLNKTVPDSDKEGIPVSLTIPTSQIPAAPPPIPSTQPPAKPPPPIPPRTTSDQFYLRVKNQITPMGEYPIAGDGNCLFACFAAHHGNLTPQQVRRTVLDWILENYGSDNHLQMHLIHALQETYIEQQKALLSEITSLVAFDVEGAVEDYAIQQQKNALSTAYYQLNIVEQMLSAIEKAFKDRTENKSGLEHLENVLIKGPEVEYRLNLITTYLETAARDDVFGGASELYALSKIYNVSVYIHRKTAAGISQDEPRKFNEGLPNILHLSFSGGNHYNCYFPQSIKT